MAARNTARRHHGRRATQWSEPAGNPVLGAGRLRRRTGNRCSLHRRLTGRAMSILTSETLSPRFTLSGNVMQTLYRVLAVALLCVALTMLSDVFLTANNILNVLRQTARLFLMASGLTMRSLTAALDLSIGANVALSGC